MDACIWRHARSSVEAGMREYQKALALAKSTGDLARAYAELGHGYLMCADYDAAIRNLKEALAIEPWNRAAQDYLRQAFRRRGRGRERIVTVARPPSGWYSDGYSMPPLNTGFPGYGFGFQRLSRADARDVRTLIHRLSAGTSASGQHAGASAADRATLQEARNRLDELLPGAGTRYAARTGNVLAVDLDQATARLERLEILGLITP
jgi:tetratricopeptide (TPR) repeat protein